MKTLENIQSLKLLNIEGLTDLSDENAASCRGGVSARFVPDGSSVGGPGPGLILYEKSLLDGHGNLRPGFDKIENRGPRVEVDISVGQTVNIPSIANDRGSSAVLKEGSYRIHTDSDGGGASFTIRAGIAICDLATGSVEFVGGKKVTGETAALPFDDNVSSITRIG